MTVAKSIISFTWGRIWILLGSQCLLIPALNMLGPTAVAYAQSEPSRPSHNRESKEAGFADTLRLALSTTSLGDYSSVIKDFYKNRSYEPIWVGARGFTAKGHNILAAFKVSSQHGLVPENYLPPPDLQPAATELAISRSVLELASDLAYGQIAFPVNSQNDFKRPKQVFSALSVAKDPGKVLFSWAPPNPSYDGLRDALAIYRRYARNGGWPQVRGSRLLKEGDTEPAVEILRRRLEITGDLAKEGSAQNKFYDRRLANAVKQFQIRHGLKVDGIVGPETRGALNVPAEQRVHAIKLNLERLRWLPNLLGSRYVLVNIADFRLTLVENQKKVFQSAVVVGTRYRQTPIFSNKIQRVVVNPYWEIPNSIVIGEIAPKMAKDASYLKKENMEVLSGWGLNATVINPTSLRWDEFVASGQFPYRIRQRPGPENALGRLKILFPNKFSVYLHDTPAQTLFGRHVRAFSHGCVRVEKVRELAQLLFASVGQKVNIYGLISSEETRSVSLAYPVPVHIVYLTAWKDGAKVDFRPDIYGRDTLLAKQIAENPKF